MDNFRRRFKIVKNPIVSKEDGVYFLSTSGDTIPVLPSFIDDDPYIRGCGSEYRYILIIKNKQYKILLKDSNSALFSTAANIPESTVLDSSNGLENTKKLVNLSESGSYNFVAARDCYRPNLTIGGYSAVSYLPAKDELEFCFLDDEIRYLLTNAFEVAGTDNFRWMSSINSVFVNNRIWSSTGAGSLSYALRFSDTLYFDRYNLGELLLRIPFVSFV